MTNRPTPSPDDTRSPGDGPREKQAADSTPRALSTLFVREAGLFRAGPVARTMRLVLTGVLAVALGAGVWLSSQQGGAVPPAEPVVHDEAPEAAPNDTPAPCPSLHTDHAAPAPSTDRSDDKRL
jgi:hypothetical protein